MSDRMTDIKRRLAELPRLPYKEFPMFVLEFDENYKPTEKSDLMNQYMRFGYQAQFDMDWLIRELETCQQALRQFDHRGKP